MKDINMKPGYLIFNTCKKNHQVILLSNSDDTNEVWNVSFRNVESTKGFKMHEDVIGQWQPKGTKERDYVISA